MSIVRAVTLLALLGACTVPEVSSRMAFDPYQLTPITD